MFNSGRTKQETLNQRAVRGFGEAALLAAALCMCLLLAPLPLAAQLAEGGTAPDCSGPLGALLPECRSGTSMEVSDYIRRPNGSPAVAPVAVRSRDPRP